jgi:hypothetical protein
MRTFVISFCTIATVVVAAPAASQSFEFEDDRPSERGSRASRTFGGIQLFVGQPVGDFDRNVGATVGVGGHLVRQLTSSGELSLRLDAGYLLYGRESKHIAFPPPIGGRISAELHTNNNFAFFGVGPQIMAPSGRVRPYVNGSVGVKYLATNSYLDGDDDENSVFNTTNWDDVALAWSGGGGVYVALRRGLRPVSLDLGARYQSGDETSYLAEGGITDNPDGSITVHPVRGRTDVVVYHFGVNVGF